MRRNPRVRSIAGESWRLDEGSVFMRKGIFPVEVVSRHRKKTPSVVRDITRIIGAMPGCRCHDNVSLGSSVCCCRQRAHVTPGTSGLAAPEGNHCKGRTIGCLFFSPYPIPQMDVCQVGAAESAKSDRLSAGTILWPPGVAPTETF